MNVIKILKNRIMKKIKIALLSAFAILGSLTSCDENIVIYDPETGQTLAFFTNGSSNFAVLIDQSGTLDIELGVSTISSSERTVAVSIDASSTADAQNYTIASSVTIPANEFFGVLTVTAIDNTIETSAETIVINIDGVDGAEVAGNASHTISLFQVCEITPGTFVGDYFLEHLSNSAACFAVATFEDQVVSIISTGDTSRSFTANFLGGYSIGQPDSTVPFSLVCNEVIVGSDIATFLACAGEPSIVLGPAIVPANYDSADDSVFELSLTENPGGGCGCNSPQVTFRLTKQ